METRLLNWVIGPTVGGAALGMMLPFTRAREIQGDKNKRDYFF
ncbi:hypothetical protein [Duganella vulcania]|nr:hypothetical protein [Duganella vulcania]